MLYSLGKESKKGAQRHFGIFQFKSRVFKIKGKENLLIVQYSILLKTKQRST